MAARIKSSDAELTSETDNTRGVHRPVIAAQCTNRCNTATKETAPQSSPVFTTLLGRHTVIIKIKFDFVF